MFLGLWDRLAQKDLREAQEPPARFPDRLDPLDLKANRDRLDPPVLLRPVELPERGDSPESVDPLDPRALFQDPLDLVDLRGQMGDWILHF